MTGDRLVDRASPSDLVSLASDAGSAPTQVGEVIVLQAAKSVDRAKLESVITARVRSIPRLRQRLVRTPLGCGRPIWVDDAEFDIARHLRSMICPPPGDEHTILELATELVTRRLPGSRPLWSATLVSGLTDNRTALVLVFHHVLADGIGGLAILANLVDGEPSADPMPFPLRAPSRRALAIDAWTTRLSALPHPRRFTSTLHRASPNCRRNRSWPSAAR